MLHLRNRGRSCGGIPRSKNRPADWRTGRRHAGTSACFGDARGAVRPIGAGHACLADVARPRRLARAVPFTSVGREIGKTSRT